MNLLEKIKEEHTKIRNSSFQWFGFELPFIKPEPSVTSLFVSGEPPFILLDVEQTPQKIVDDFVHESFHSLHCHMNPIYWKRYKRESHMESDLWTRGVEVVACMFEALYYKPDLNKGIIENMGREEGYAIAQKDRLYHAHNNDLPTYGERDIIKSLIMAENAFELCASIREGLKI